MCSVARRCRSHLPGPFRLFPGQLGEFIQRNLAVTVAERGPFQIVSMLLLLFTANGIFEPLEVALNRAWGAPKHRPTGATSSSAWG